MFTKKDYLAYFRQLLEIEMGMEKEASDLLHVIKDPDARKILLKVQADERRHAELVREMMAMVSPKKARKKK